VGSHELGERVSLSRDLVTVAQYAQFLEASPDAPLPQQEEVGWRREGRTIRYVVNLSDRPVVGISRAEAERYIDWLRVEEVRLGSSGALKLQLPEPEWLQIAALGSHLTSPEADGGGVYGHERLTGVVWQWTSRAGPGAHQTQVFGGSASIGSPATPGSAQKSLMLGWPDLCRAADDESGHADVGFRIARIEP
jgi:formylglycine-generating enzyme required for sulfatase activity